MNVLHIALNGGFQGQRVTIAVNGRKVYQRDGLTTDLRISHADAVDVDMQDARQAEVTVTVHPGAGPQSTTVDVEATPHVAIELEADGAVTWSTSATVMPML